MKQFYTYYQRTNHINVPADRKEGEEKDLKRTNFDIAFWDKMIEVSKVERVVSTYILDDNIYYEAV
jgi:hypothetical protein